jgi:hypothetical protein
MEPIGGVNIVTRKRVIVSTEMTVPTITVVSKFSLELCHELEVANK